ncbi:MAG: phytoene/squalene synthase family protein [Planctomycetota bacterium]|jgi:phytoene synthase
MSGTDRVVEASYAFCQSAARAAGSNFYTCFALLRRPKRRAMHALYAFLRHTDDLADSDQPVEVRRAALARWRTSLERALSDRPAAPDPDRLGRRSSTLETSVMPALGAAVRRFQIPPEHLYAVLDGVEMDLDRRRYETFDELAQYCRRVASAVGMACIHIWGFHGRDAFEPADKCGVAFQLTNILRDLREDSEGGRVYLPLEDLRQFGYSPEDLAAGTADERFRRLMIFQIDRARRLYREGVALYDWLDPDGRRIFGMMVGIYGRLLEKIARRPSDVLSRRVRLSRFKKLSIAARWALLPARRPALP